jgi:hypothetical protein
LIKGGSGSLHQEHLNEVAASVIMKRLGINYVPYSLVIENGKPYSFCENFVTSETDLIPAWYVMQTRKKSNNISEYQHFIDCCSGLGLSDVQSSLDKMLLTDYIIANEDRHYSNFGIIRHAESIKILDFAPVYDSGTSLWCNTPTVEISTRPKTESKPFRSCHENQIKLINDFSWLDLSVLDDVDEELHEIFFV